MSSSKPKTPKSRLPVASPHTTSSVGEISPTPIFTPKIRRQIPDDVYEKEVQPYIEVASEKKRNFSQVSAASNEEIKRAISAKKQKHKSDERTSAGTITMEIRKKIDARIAVLEAELDATN